jgi:hypothetical protein
VKVQWLCDLHYGGGFGMGGSGGWCGTELVTNYFVVNSYKISLIK